MIKCLLHIRDADRLIEDEDGHDYPSLAAAEAAARALIAEFVAEQLWDTGRATDRWVEVCDETGAVHSIVCFADDPNSNR